MYNLGEPPEPIAQPNPFAKYGLVFTPDNHIIYSKKPPLYSKTPVICIEEGKVSLLSKRDFLQKCFTGTGKISIEEEKQQIIDVVAAIFTSVTKQSLTDYANFIFMDQEDWAKFKKGIGSNAKADEGKNYDAIHLSGLIVLGVEGNNALFPLLFHELGHSLYPPSHDLFTDEMRAFYFEIICQEFLEAQLHKMGISCSYPEYDDNVFPSKAHKKAYFSAKTLYAYQKLNKNFKRHGLPQLPNRQDDHSSNTIEQLLEMIK